MVRNIRFNLMKFPLLIIIATWITVNASTHNERASDIFFQANEQVDMVLNFIIM